MPAVLLESFDNGADTAPAPDLGYDTGYAAGRAEALAEAAAAQDALQAEVVQTIADLGFTFAEAKRDITLALGPLFDQVIDTLLPHCVRVGFGGEIASLITARLQEALGGGLSLTVHPDQETALTSAFAGVSVRPQIATDASLKPHEAWVGFATSTTHLDLDTLCDDIGSILSAIHLTPERTQSHG